MILRNLPSARRPFPHAFAVLTVAMIAAALMTVVSPARAATMQAPGSRVSLELPKDFKASPLFSGFMEIISSAAVIVVDMPPEAYETVATGFNAEALAKKGIEKVEVGKLERSDDHLFLTGQQPHPAALIEKFILVIKDDKNTAVITFNVPQGSFENASIKREAVIKALTSARLEDSAAPSQELFSLGYLGPFELSGRPAGTSRIYVETGDESPKETRNIMAIAPSLNRLPIRDVKDFAQYALNNLNNVTDLTVTSDKAVTIDNMAGHQITADATNSDGKTPVTVRQLILLPAAGGYFRLLTINKAADDDRLAPEIEKVFASFKAADVGLAQ